MDRPLVCTQNILGQIENCGRLPTIPIFNADKALVQEFLNAIH